ncbi:MAG: AAA family ATPase [Lachnospiraceae bacterium]|nr:AAA family ATPase [Lachnospiraceae bacterium]
MTLLGKLKEKKRPMTKKESLILLLVIIFVAFLIILPSVIRQDNDKKYYMSYAEFVDKMEDDKVISVTITDDKVTFELNNGEKRNTDNPDYDTFKRDLLKRGIEVKDGKSMSGAIVFVTDMLFNIIFFAIIGFLILKFWRTFGGGEFKVSDGTDVSFDDICGMEDVKEEMMSAVEILKNPQRFASMGIRPLRGIVLEGPPGNGKTLFAKALATECDVNFIAAKGADFQSALMSMGAVKTKSLFKKAARKKPCIVFIDEFDSIGERRNYTGTGIDKENNRIITTMLNMMDGFEEGDGVLVIAATNSYHSLDPALIRPGRFDLKYHIGNPDIPTILQLIELYTIGKGISSDLDKEESAKSFEGLSCAAIETIINEASSMAIHNGGRTIGPVLIEEARRRTGLLPTEHGEEA